MAATVTLKAVIVSSDRALDPSGSGLLTNRRAEQDFSHSMTVASAATVCAAAGSQIYSYIFTNVTGEVSEIQCQVVVENVDAVEYSTPRAYASYPGLSTPTKTDAIAQQPTSENRTSFIVGPSDYTDGTTLGAKLLAGVTAATNAIQ